MIKSTPDIDVSPLTYDFGEVEVGTSSATTVTISNVGSSDLEVVNLHLRGTDLCNDFSIPRFKDQDNNVSTDTSYGCGYGDPNSLYQSFTPSDSSIVAIELLLRAGGSFFDTGHSTTIKLRANDPTGTILGTATTNIPGPLSTGSQITVLFEFSSAIALTPGGTYVIEWIMPVEGDVILTWMGSDTNPYPLGNAFSCAGSPVTERDYVFTTYTALSVVTDVVNTYTTGTSYGCGISSANLYQSFTPNADTIVAIELLLRAGGSFPESGCNSTIYLRYNSTTGLIIGTATTFIPGPVITGAEVEVLHEFPSAISLTIGEIYVIEWDTPPEGDVVLTWMGSDENPYLYGNAFSCAMIAMPEVDFVFTTFVSLDTVIDQENDYTDGTSYGCGYDDPESLYQSFIPTVSSLEAVRLRLRAGGGFPDIGETTSVNIRANTPTGTILGTAEAFVSGPQATGTIMEVYFLFLSTITLTTGNTYVIEWITPLAGDIILTWMGSDDDDYYTDGTAYGCSGDPMVGVDFIFATFTLKPILSTSEAINVEVTYNPSSEGLCTDTLVISSDDPDETIVEVQLSGTGITPTETTGTDGTSSTTGPTNAIIFTTITSTIAISVIIVLRKKKKV